MLLHTTTTLIARARVSAARGAPPEALPRERRGQLREVARVIEVAPVPERLGPRGVFEIGAEHAPIIQCRDGVLAIFVLLWDLYKEISFSHGII